jgi:hypothetical protein
VLTIVAAISEILDPTAFHMGLKDQPTLEGARAKALYHPGVTSEPERCSEPDEVIPTTAMPRKEARRPGDLFSPEAAAILVVFVLLVIFAVSRLSLSRKSGADPGQLGLSAELHGEIVEVKWNPASPAIRDSERGALEIVKGADVNRIELNQSQLRAGHFSVYTPAPTDLACFFSLYRGQNVFIGSMQSVHLNLPQTEAAASFPEQPIDPAPATLEPSIGNLSPAKPRNEKTLRTAKSSLHRKKRPGGRTLVRSGVVSFTPPPVVNRPTPVPRTEDPPELEKSGLSTAALIPNLPSALSAFEPPLTFAPIPIKRVNPALPRPASLAIPRDVSIRVAVQIDREGRVKDARPLNDEDATERLLAKNAAQAARRWRFNPARRDGIPIASETVLVFQFAKNL